MGLTGKISNFTPRFLPQGSLQKGITVIKGGIMRKIIGILISTIVILLLTQSLLYAECGGPKPGGGKKIMREHGGPVFGDPVRMQKELGLTGEQVKKIAEINKNHERKMLDYREQLAPKYIQLKKLLLDDNVNIDKVRPLVKEISDLRAELHILRIQHQLEIEKVLTPEQKANMKLYRKQIIKKKGFGSERHGHDWQGLGK
jgi:Spy/CpxP family protein refolding chaperone